MESVLLGENKRKKRRSELGKNNEQLGVWRKQHFAGKQGIRAQLVYEGVVVRAEEVDGAVVLSDRTQISTESPKRWNYLPFELYCAERKLEASEILRSDSHSGSPIVDQTKSPFRVASATESRLSGFQQI